MIRSRWCSNPTLRTPNFSPRFKTKNTYVDEVIQQAVKKKIVPAIERRIRTELTEAAEDGAIQLFSENLRNLLLIPPLKGRVVLGFDPAFRTGAKLAVVDETGKMLTTQVIYPVAPAKPAQIEQAKKDLSSLIKEFEVEIIAIGNGTASRESEAFVAEVLHDHPGVRYVIVNESGASVYSASELARHEFPELKPGRDLRDSFDAPVLRQDVLDIKDLHIGQKLEGVVRNVVDFGAFVDIGIHEDGLIHISHMSKQFIKHPSQVVSVGDLVTVWVKKIDVEREKVNLSLVAPNESN